MDLVLSSSRNLVADIARKGRLRRSDHDILMSSATISAMSVKNRKMKHDYKRANFQAMRDGLTREWSALLADCNVEEAWQKIRDNLHAMIEVKGRDKPLWMSNKIEKAIVKKKETVCKERRKQP